MRLCNACGETLFDGEDADLEDLEEKINNLLDCVERPLGTLKAQLPHTLESERALVALFDSIGRTL